ncbi:MAG: hypothetical protein JWM51_1887 [Microbacteriaceae bacterium]|nr:hypothetical protein [Microbacteriaceae bacterium]
MTSPDSTPLPPEPITSVADAASVALARVVVSEHRLDAGDRQIGLRVFVPVDADTDADLDTVVYARGGAQPSGAPCAADVALLATELGARLLLVDYRRAPGHPFPAPYDDVLAAVRGVAARGGYRTLSLAGDGTGANLALATAITVRAELPLDALLLLYPQRDPDAENNGDYRWFGNPHEMGRSAESTHPEWQYTERGPAQPPGQRARAVSLLGLPPTVLVGAGFDPLYDEGRALASRLVRDDVDVVFLPNPTLPQDFQREVGTSDDAANALQRAYSAFASLIAAAHSRS